MVKLIILLLGTALVLEWSATANHDQTIECPHLPPPVPTTDQVDSAFRYPFGLPPSLVGDNPRDGLPVTSLGWCMTCS